MTTFGPDRLFSCPRCETALRRRILRSGNTFGSTLWSDGYLDAPMRPPEVHATRCPSCAKAFFVEDGKDLGDVPFPGLIAGGTEVLPGEFDATPTAEHADLDALFELANETRERDRLRYLCMQIWYAQNHPRRNAQAAVAAPNPEGFDANLERLIALLDDDGGGDQLTKTEALREIGMFAEAMAKVQNVDPKLAWASAQIRAMIEAGKTAVAVLYRPGEGPHIR